MRSKTHLLRFAAATFLATVVALIAFVLIHAQRTLSSAGRTASVNRQAAFTLLPYDTAAQVASNPGFESVARQPSFTSGTVFAGELYLGGPTGLSVVAPDGTTRYSLRSGFELPVAPITAVVAGRLRGASDTQLLLATAGAGLLLLTPGQGAVPRLQQLLPADSAARDVTALLPLATGDLLLGTRHHGVLLFNGATLTPFRPALPGLNPATLEITALAASDSTSFLIGTRNAGVLYARAGTVAVANVSTGLPDNQIESLAVSATTAYVGTPVGVAQFNLSSDSFRPTRVLAVGAFANALAVTPMQLTVGTLDQGIAQLAVGPQPRLRTVAISAPRDAGSGRSSQRIDAFLGASDGSDAMAFALADGKMLRHTAGGWSASDPAGHAALADANISALAFTPEGRLYVGFFDHGLDIVDTERQTAPVHLEDDHLFCINRLALDPVRHTIAAATANGLVLFDATGTPRQTLTRRDGLISDHVTDVVFTQAGAYAGMALATPAGITLMSQAGIESLYAFQGLVNNHVYALAADGGSGQLFAGTLGGLSILHGNSVVRNFSTSNSALAHNWITAVARMPDGNFIVGTYGAGLQRLAATGVFSSVDLPAGTPRDLVINPNALLVTPTHVYAGTLSHGMLVYSMRTGRWNAVTTGLPSWNITAFAEHAGELYVGTENGLVRIAETALEERLQ